MRSRSESVAFRSGRALSRRAAAATTALAALLLLAVPAAGQGLDLGAQAGVNISDLSQVDEAGGETESITGFRVGGVVRLGLGGAFGLRSGIHLTRSGARSTETDPFPGAGFNGELRLTRLEVPLAVSLAVPTGGSLLTPRLYAGGQVAFELDCEVADLDCDDPADTLFGETETTSFSLVFGGGIDFAAGPGKITLDARYDHGLTDVIDDSELRQVGGDQRTRNIALSAGYLIGLP